MNIRSATLVLSILLACGPLIAVHAEEAARHAVKVSDLDLRADAGIHKLYARIQAAARVVCETYDIHTLGSLTVVKRCRAQAVTDAITELSMPALTRYHVEQSGQQLLVVRR